MKEKVLKELLGYIETVGTQFRDFPWENPVAYKNWLAFTYYYVSHTTCFLALTASRWGVKNRKQQYRALQHLREESAHDLLLLNDLKAMGSSIEKHPESPITQAFYQTQYYWIEHETPAAHLGYAYLLEGIAAKHCPSNFKKVSEAHGKEAGTFLRVHAEEDPHHFEEGLKNLESFNEYELDCFSQCLRQTAALYLQMLEQAKKT